MAAGVVIEEGGKVLTKWCLMMTERGIGKEEASRSLEARVAVGSWRSYRVV